MDAFYASVELLRYPELRGQPVVIGGGSRHKPVDETDALTGKTTRRYSTLRCYVGRGVITTATYEARALGLHSAMGMMKAAQLAPDAVLLPVDFDEYRKYSRLFKATVRAIAPEIEDRGIDEIYADLTDIVDPSLDPWVAAREKAAEIKRAIRDRWGEAVFDRQGEVDRPSVARITSCPTTCNSTPATSSPRGISARWPPAKARRSSRCCPRSASRSKAAARTSPP